MDQLFFCEECWYEKPESQKKVVKISAFYHKWICASCHLGLKPTHGIQKHEDTLHNGERTQNQSPKHSEDKLSGGKTESFGTLQQYFDSIKRL